MKLQFLGDSKDSFKWDYHDYLTTELGFPRLTVALMLTPDDAGAHGQTKAESYPARPSILSFCQKLQAGLDVAFISSLPSYTGSPYQLILHKGAASADDREAYFSELDSTVNQIFFLDPDNGFEPEKTSSDRHVRYNDITGILQQLNEQSIVSVFQHFRRISFREDFARIMFRLGQACATAIYWHSVMFIAIANSKGAIERVREANSKYAQTHPVHAI
jgi:hypothetical protein